MSRESTREALAIVDSNHLTTKQSLVEVQVVRGKALTKVIFLESERRRLVESVVDDVDERIVQALSKK